MNYKHLSLLLVASFTLFGLPGCAHYRARPLTKLSSNVSPAAHEQAITFDYKVFTTRDCYRYLDRDVLEKGYQPVQITLNNNTKHSLSFDTEAFSFPVAPADEVAMRVHTSTTKRVVGYGVVGLFLWPFLIPAIVDGIGSEKANKQLDADFAFKVLRSQTIKPYSSINGIVFVPSEEFHNDFTFTLVNLETKDHFVMEAGCSKLILD